MSDKYYSVEQVSEMLDMHPKTIQRYIREGKLCASKIGKSWRINGHDLSLFIENTNERKLDIQPKVKISSVVDIEAVNPDEGIRIANTLTAALNSKPLEYGSSTMYVQYLEYESKVRVTLWGSIGFMKEMIEFISVLTDQTNYDGGAL